jgi:hypothetical protein
MEARSIRPSWGMAAIFFSMIACCASVEAQVGHRQFVAHGQNFIAFASTPQWAAQVVEAAERNRRDLAIHWLGSELPPWSERVPIHVSSAPNLGAAGETRFSLKERGGVGNWMMSVQGTQERILDSVLPHEITHTIFATHFSPLGKYVPRWADEGACTTVEHVSEKRKHEHYLHEFLRTGRGLAFNRMFNLKEYPQDILPLYAQGHSAVQFLLDQGGPRKFVQFLETGMRSGAWDKSLKDFYAYDSIGQFQTLWNQWLFDGSPEDLQAYAPGMRGAVAGAETVLAASSESVMASQPVQLASASAATTADNQTLGNDSWYRRRLHEVSRSATGEPADNSSTRAAAAPVTNVSSASSLATGGAYPLQPYHVEPAQLRPTAKSQATARPLPAQSTGIQVLDWGDSVPVSGIQQPTSQAPAGMVPIYR